MIGALLAQGRSVFEAALLGAYVHGRAGEAAARELTPLGVTAEDVPEFIPDALGEMMEWW
jgi:NAD(P)H-hydrate epimerase